MNLVSGTVLLDVLTCHFWSSIWEWWPAQHLSLLLDLKPQCFTAGYHKLNLMSIKRAYQAWGQDWCRVHSDLGRLKEISPLLYFLFPLPFTLVMDTQGEFLLSSKSCDYWRRENGWHHRSHKWKMKQWQKARFLIIPFEMLLPPEFVWYEFFLISISIRNEKNL